MPKQIAINLYDGVMAALHANPGVHAPYNIIDCPPIQDAGNISDR